MGKRIRVQRRGKGSQVWRSPSHKHVGDIKHRPLDLLERTSVVRGVVRDIFHAPGRSAPVMEILYETGEKILMIAPEGICVGDTIENGPQASIKIGNTLPLANIPEGVPIYNIEKLPGDGGKFVRASGTYALIVTKDIDKVIVRMPSGQLKEFKPDCRATIGVVAGGGRTDKPFVKAGKKYHALSAKATYWPVVRGCVMNPVDHPFGGGNHKHPHKPTTTARGAPPGRKVGLIAARRTGWRR